MVNLPKTGSEGYFRLSCFWLLECLARYPFCKSRSTTFTPTRLLEIQSCGISGSLSVKLNQNPSAGFPYCALSYRWGDVQDELLLNSENLASFEHEILFESLPKTIRQAVEITHALGKNISGSIAFVLSRIQRSIGVCNLDRCVPSTSTLSARSLPKAPSILAKECLRSESN